MHHLSHGRCSRTKESTFQGASVHEYSRSAWLYVIPCARVPTECTAGPCLVSCSLQKAGLMPFVRPCMAHRRRHHAHR